MCDWSNSHLLPSAKDWGRQLWARGNLQRTVSASCATWSQRHRQMSTTYADVLYTTRSGGTHIAFSERVWGLSRMTALMEQRCLGLFLLELFSHRESLLHSGVAIHRGSIQRQLTDFFNGAQLAHRRPHT
eukprot:c769_g1_i1 orf=3-389(-)